MDHDELAMLRARAYGPNADIDADPAAVARLRELEDRLHSERESSASEGRLGGRRTITSAAATEAILDASPPVGPDESVSALPPSSAGSTDRGSRPTRRARRWWLPAVWAFSIVLGVALGAVIPKPSVHDDGDTSTTAAVDFSSLGLSAYHRVATLAVFDAGVWPDATFGPDPNGFQFQWFHGMAVLAPAVSGAGREHHCLTIVAGAKRHARYSATACTGAALTPGIVPLTVTESAPAALRAAFPIGTRLLFALSGGEVGVFARGTANADDFSPSSVPPYPPAPDPFTKLHGYREVTALSSAGATDPHGSFAGGQQFDGFDGLSVVTLPDQTIPDHPSCLVVSTATPDHRSTPYATTTCGPAMAPAVAQLTVTPAAPRALRAAFSLGTGLLFVFDGDDVIVYADRAPNT